MLGLYARTMLGMLGLHARTPMPGARGRHRMQGSSPGRRGQPRARMVSWHGVLALDPSVAVLFPARIPWSSEHSSHKTPRLKFLA